MTQVTIDMLSVAMSEYVEKHKSEPGDHQLAFLLSLKHGLMGDTIIQFIDRVVDDRLSSLRQTDPSSPLISQYEKILIIEE